ncbi:MAG: hypothetical protein VR64_24365 [Desulfatitalea sp. BRH_c12]|nr:MAG: hypothetical protein VR64_24365 [Desulfatitalea sp. BRH_c12]
MKSDNMANNADGQRMTLIWPFIVSFLGHIILFGYLLYTPGPKMSGSMGPSVIDVQMVDMPGAPASPKQAPSEGQKAPVVETPKPPEAKAEVAVTPPKTEPKAEISIAPKPKVALKYKTFKSPEVLKNTLEKVQQKVETATAPPSLDDTIKRIREQVAKDQRGQSSGNTDAGTGTASEGSGAGKSGGFGTGGNQEGEAVDLYRLEVAFTINKNWAFSEQLAGVSDNLVVLIVFKVMPDGRIEDIFFTDRSGNAYLDDSAYKAIVKSSPVKPHPEGLRARYIEMGLRFTPQGVR